MMKIIYSVFFILLFFSSCSTNEKKSENTEQTHIHQVFTCPMHPQVIKNEMGTCPICGMDLVPFVKDSDDKHLKIDEQRELLANIQTQKEWINQSLSNNLSYQAILTNNAIQNVTISAKNAGRIERLYVRQLGEQVNKGQLLYELYSEELAALQQEYLMTLAQQKQFSNDKIENQLLLAAKHKLKLLGQTDQQINSLAQSQKKNPLIKIYADKSGIVNELSVYEGQYVEIGSAIVQLADYSKLWVEVLVYPQDAKKFTLGTAVKVVINGWEDQPQLAKIDFVDPFLQSGTQFLKVRATINNVKQKWQSGLQAKVSLLDIKSINHSFVLPVDAVIRDAKGEHVWIKTSKNQFEPKKVETKTANADYVKVISGLDGSEELVVKGAYLLYSEYQLRKGKHPLDK